MVSASLLAGGCVTYEGVMLVEQPIGSTALAKYGAQPSSDVERDNEADDGHAPVAGLIVIGHTSAYREFSERGSRAAWNSYVGFQEKHRQDHSPIVTEDAFLRDFSGWTRLKVTGIPFISACYERVLVPAPLADEIVFADPVGTFMFQISEDLVAARTNADGVFVAAQRLCARGKPGYGECARRYQQGYFDAGTGLMLGGKLRPHRSGKRIDPVTFLRVDAAVAGMSAAD